VYLKANQVKQFKISGKSSDMGQFCQHTLHILPEESHFNLNITIMDLDYSGWASDDCRYWGIYVRHAKLYGQPLLQPHVRVMNSFYMQIDPYILLWKVIETTKGLLLPIPYSYQARKMYKEGRIFKNWTWKAKLWSS